MAIESVMSSNDLILCGPLLLLPSVFPSIRVAICKAFKSRTWTDSIVYVPVVSDNPVKVPCKSRTLLIKSLLAGGQERWC